LDTVSLPEKGKFPLWKREGDDLSEEARGAGYLRKLRKKRLSLRGSPRWRLLGVTSKNKGR